MMRARVWFVVMGIAGGASACGGDESPGGSGGAAGVAGATGGSSGTGGAAGAGGGGAGGAGARGGAAGVGGLSGAGGGAAGTAGAGGVPCLLPDVQRLEEYRAGDTLTFVPLDGAELEVGLSLDPGAAEPAVWTTSATLTLSVPTRPAEVRVFARVRDRPTCRSEFSARVVDAFRGAGDQPDSGAVPRDLPSWRGWATGFVEPVDYGSDLDARWRTPDLALGPASGGAFDVVALGNGGSITLVFDPPIADGPGADFAVFENAFNDTFLELALVEVSSDGVTFVRFDSASLGAEPVPFQGARVDPATLEGLAGKHRAGFGTAFDLALLSTRHAVQERRVDLGRIRFVRILDVVGDGSVQDSFGRPIYDPTPTVGSGGFDLDAVGVLHQAR